MTSQAPNNDNPPSSLQPTSTTSTPQPKAVQDLVAWSLANQHGPPHREKTERKPGDGLRNHRGPIRITARDGVLTEYGRKLEQERLAKLEAAKEAAKEGGGEKGGESSS